MKMKRGIIFSLFLAVMISLSVLPRAPAQSSGFNVLHTFQGTTVLSTNSDGTSPQSSLVSSGETLYGTATAGGSAGNGTVFRINLDGSGFTNLHSFTAIHGPYSTNSDGATPEASLILSGNSLYGTTYNGGNSGKGTVFKVNTDGSGFATLHSFAGGGEGAQPEAGLIMSGNALYGTTTRGGISNNGTVFRINVDGSSFTNLHNFTSTSGFGTNNDGVNPRAGLSLMGSALFGTASGGGRWGNGTVFRINTDGSGFTDLHDFTSLAGGSGGTPFRGTNGDGAYPEATLVLSGNILFGTADYGGDSGSGTIFKINTDGSGFAIIHGFTWLSSYYKGTNSDGGNPRTGLILSGNTLYGTTYQGGSSGNGTVFSLNSNSSDFTVLHTFTMIETNGGNGDGANPQAGLVLSSNVLYGTTYRGGSSGKGALFQIQSDDLGFATLHSFSATESDLITSDGAYPSELILSGNTLYGTTYGGGRWNRGTVFSVTTNGSSYTNLHSFDDGGNPRSLLILTNNTLYGTTASGGNSGYGAVFKINTDGSAFTNLHSFPRLSIYGTNSEGAYPDHLILSGETLYGTAGGGGSAGAGTLFRINTDGSSFTNLHTFTATLGGDHYWSGTNSDGYSPNGLILSGNTLYGTTSLGGSAGNGTVFKLSIGGSSFTTLHSFTALYSGLYGTNGDGASPNAGLVLSGDTLYGTTESGGNFAKGTVFRINTNGTDFQNLHSYTLPSGDFFSGTNSDGANPGAGLFLSGSALYGTTVRGGSSGNGTVFRINTDGAGFASLYSFTYLSGDTYSANSDGALPSAGLILSDSTLFGTAPRGGSSGDGTVFALNLFEAPPSLAIILAGNQVILAWPTSATNCVLQTSPSLSSGSWTEIKSGIGIVGANHVFTNTVTDQAFFRLKLP